MTLAIPLSSVKIRHEEKLGGRERRQQRGTPPPERSSTSERNLSAAELGPIPSTMPLSAARYSRRGLVYRRHCLSRTLAPTMFSQACIGLIVFNCLAYRKNSATERRVSQENAAELHVVQEVPSLRVIGDGLWQRVKMRKENWREARTERHLAGPGFNPHTCQGLASSAAHVHRSAQEPSPERPLALAAIAIVYSPVRRSRQPL